MIVHRRGQREISQDEFDEIYIKHQKWLENRNLGQQAILRYTDLSNIDFSNSKNLSMVDMANSNLERVDLSNSHFERANLNAANFYKANLSGSVFAFANISEAIMRDADLSGSILYKAKLNSADLRNARLIKCNLDETDLFGADLGNANLSYTILTNADLNGVNLLSSEFRGAVLGNCRISDSTLEYLQSRGALVKTNPFDTIENIDKKKLLETQQKLTFLEEEKSHIKAKLLEQSLQLNKLQEDLKIAQNKEEENHILADTISRLHLEIEETKEKVQEKDKIIEQEKRIAEEKIKEIEQRGKDIELGLKDAFDGLSNADDEIKPEINKLNGIFWGFTCIAILLLGVLTYIWVTAFHDLHGLDMKISKIWIYTAPSLIIVGFIWASILQINRAQRLLISIRNDNKKYKIIKLALEGYYRVEDKLNKTPIKAQETFSSIMDFEMEKKYDASIEEEKLSRECKKDQIPAKELLDQVINYVEKLK